MWIPYSQTLDDLTYALLPPPYSGYSLPCPLSSCYTHFLSSLWVHSCPLWLRAFAYTIHLFPTSHRDDSSSFRSSLKCHFLKGLPALASREWWTVCLLLHQVLSFIKCMNISLFMCYFPSFFPSRVETQGNRAQPYFMEHLVSGAEGHAKAFRISVLSLVLSLLPYPRVLVTSPAFNDVSLCQGAGVGRLSFPRLAPLVPNRERSTSRLHIVTLLI